MSINDFGEKVKSKIGPFYTLLLCLLIASIFFALGRISALNDIKQPIKVLNQTGAVINSQNTGSDLQISGNNQVESSTSSEVVASKTGKKYYYPWCGTAKRIKPENLVKFASIDIARSKGYTPAENCAGLK